MSQHEQPIRVMVVDDSSVIRGLLSRIIEAQPDMRVVASVADGRVATEMIRHRPADVVLLDVEMPEMDGIEALPLLLRERPGMPVIMTSSLTQHGAEVTLRALALGAADYVPKPSTLSAIGGAAAIADDLVTKVRALGRGRRGPGADGRAITAPASPGAASAARDARVRLLAIAASTGGPNALARLLSALPVGFPVPIVVVQHMPPVFTAALAERLARETGRPCREAQHGELIEDGRTYIAPGNHHLTVTTAAERPALSLDQGAPVNFCRPAADPLLRSVARVYGATALTVVLTGMGEDGLEGCREMERQGGRILVQDQASSVVWGMPGAVYRAGLADAALPLPALAERILQLCAPDGMLPRSTTPITAA